MTEKITREELQMILGMEDDSKDPKWLSMRLVRLKALCTLALQAEAMQPRPIEEAPRDEEVIAWVQAGTEHPSYKPGTQGNWVAVYISKDGVVCDVSDWTPGYDEKLWSVTHFIPINALPEPKP